jgi:predicted ATPase
MAGGTTTGGRSILHKNNHTFGDYAMIRKLEIENFMSLKNVKIDLAPLTVFIGGNASGKSAVFKALVTLSKLLGGTPLRGKDGEFHLEDGVALDDLVWKGNSGLPVKFRVWLDEAPDPTYTLELSKRAEGWSVIREILRIGGRKIEVDENHSFDHPTERFGQKSWKPPLRATLRYLIHPFINDSAARPSIEPILTLTDRIGKWYRYRPSASDIARFVRAEAKEKNFFVRENGWGVALMLQALQGSKRELFTALEGDLRKLFPHVKTVGFKTDWQGVRLTFTTDRSEDPIPAPQESDGVLLATFLLWRLYTAGESVQICLEEPENGLHPHLLGDRLELLKKFTNPPTGLERAPVQILVATHSRELLRVVRAHHSALFNELRVVEFDPNSGTSVTALKNWRDAHHLIEELEWKEKNK